jgi:uroporphyrin-III C-methyltransferase
MQLLLTNFTAVHISKLCKRLRIPVNVIDAPQLSSFSLPATHTDGPLQIAVTTNGKGCKLATRIRREIASSLPSGIGSACERLGTMRKRIQAEDHFTLNELDDEESIDQSSTFNKLVTEADRDAAKSRRIRWLSQICEYWPLSRLAAITDIDVDTVLNAYAANPDSLTPPLESNTLESRSSLQGRKGRIILAGSGPGHPDLLTVATLKAIKTAHLILADKLVPEGVLNLIPRRTPVHIARKFPGNADRAQEELLEWGLAGIKEGKTVLRLKQGDPYIYGRGGEEFEFFRKEGYGDRISVLPGITSSLSAPLFAMIPPTQRAVSDQVLICTGTGRKGAPSVPPEYVPTRTVVFLMALHRIEGLVADLTTHSLENNSLNGSETGEPHDSSPDEEDKASHDRRLWPLSTPCAVIERASCPDQRVIRTTLEYVAAAIEEEGSRPPGLLVLGNCCEVLVKPDGKGGRKWVTEEGFKGLDGWGDMPDGVLDWASGVNGLGDVDGLGKPDALLTNGLREVSVQ